MPSSIRVLDLSNNHIRVLHKSAKNLDGYVSLLADLENLEDLNLKHNKIKLLLPKMFEKNLRLQVIVRILIINVSRKLM